MDSLKALVDALVKREGSERKAAMLLGVSNTAVNAWRNGIGRPGEERCLQIAEELRLDPAYVLAVVERDRTKSESAKKVWRRIADQFKDAAVVAALALGAASFGGFNNNVFAGNSTPGPSSSESGHKYTLRRYQRRRTALGVAL